MLHLDYRDPRPIYEQIRQEFMRLILAGAIAPGEKTAVRARSGRNAFHQPKHHPARLP